MFSNHSVIQFDLTQIQIAIVRVYTYFINYCPIPLLTIRYFDLQLVTIWREPIMVNYLLIVRQLHGGLFDSYRKLWIFVAILLTQN